MRIRTWLRWSMVLGVAAIAIWAGCTEDDPVVTDEMPPTVSYVRPNIDSGLHISPTAIEDTITLAVTASDPGGIELVEFWCTFHSDSVSRKLGEARTPNDEGLYTYFWETRGLTQGSSGALWAVAYDAAGNKGLTGESIPILVINTTLITPPNPDFTITPNSGGTVATTFRFDPSLTTDALETQLRKIKVRWDFDYDPERPPTWDVDTSQARANEVQNWNYNIARTYTIALQAFNDYFPGPSEIATRELVVLPEAGEPHPPAESVLVAAGTYPIGVIRSPGGQETGFNENEMVVDTLFVTLTANVFIDKYEVSNYYYVTFLNEARDSARIEYDPNSWEVTEIERGNVLITLDPNLTRILFIDEEEGFAVEDNVQHYPVTGVTWYGAKAYCAHFGLRLPSEYEWEIAARSGRIVTTANPEYIYPWSPDTTINGNYANYRNSGDPYEAAGNLRAESPIGTYSDVDSLMGSFPHENAIGPFETYDQAGNVAEWVNDWYVDDYYNSLRARYDQTGRWPSDPQGPKLSESTSGTKVVRGGSFFDSPNFLRITRREAAAPEVGSATIGFRAAYTEFNQDR